MVILGNQVFLYLCHTSSGLEIHIDSHPHVCHDIYLPDLQLYFLHMTHILCRIEHLHITLFGATDVYVSCLLPGTHIYHMEYISMQ